MIIRNDDIAFDTNPDELQWFSELCDQYGHEIMQCITPLGICIPIHVNMNNDDIVKLGGHNTFLHNSRLYDYLKERARRNDFFAVHGLWHTHSPSKIDIWTAKVILEAAGLSASYYVPPYNEGIYPNMIHGLEVCQVIDSIENSINTGRPVTTPIGYLHSWRFSNRQYKHEDLENYFKQLETKNE